jgi:hypothetical protein
MAEIIEETGVELRRDNESPQLHSALAQWKEGDVLTFPPLCETQVLQSARAQNLFRYSTRPFRWVEFIRCNSKRWLQPLIFNRSSPVKLLCDGLSD